MMDLDQCIVDGNPCEQGSMYCSDECKELDIMEHQNVFFDGDDDLDALVSSPLEQPVEYGTSPDYLLYECAFCKSTHTASTPCLHFSNNYTTEPDYLTFERDQYYNNTSNAFSEQYKPLNAGITILDTLKDYTSASSHYSDDNSLMRSNKLIQSNYRKWLVMSNQ